jgi:hypothetical protein
MIGYLRMNNIVNTTSYHFRILKDLQSSASRIGLKLVMSKRHGQELALIPDGDSLPIYSRDAEIAVGTAEYLSAIINGWERATIYYHNLGIINDTKIKNAVDRYNEKRTMDKLKTGVDIR